MIDPNSLQAWTDGCVGRQRSHAVYHWLRCHLLDSTGSAIQLERFRAMSSNNSKHCTEGLRQFRLELQRDNLVLIKHTRPRSEPMWFTTSNYAVNE